MSEIYNQNWNRERVRAGLRWFGPDDIVTIRNIQQTPGITNVISALHHIPAGEVWTAKEVAKRKITVNAVAPGFITSDMTKELNEEELKKMVPTNRFGTAQEVADLVSFLVSDKAAYITGEVININGGLYS